MENTMTLGGQIEHAHREALFMRFALKPVSLMVQVCAATGVYAKNGPPTPWAPSVRRTLGVKR